MRNIIEYPVTKIELIAYCNAKIAALSEEGLVGDVRPHYYKRFLDLLNGKPIETVLKYKV